jgi:hypothetical protein
MWRLSPDLRWRWDGQAWVAAEVSADGRWIWDGSGWQPAQDTSSALAATALAPIGSVGALQAVIADYTRHGYLVVHQTPTSVQLVRPKSFSFLWAILWFLLCGVGVLVYIFYYLGKSDEQKYFSVDQYGQWQ